MLLSPKIIPFFEETARTTLLKIHALETKAPGRPLVSWHTADPTLYHIRQNRGSQVLPPIYRNFAEAAFFSTRVVFITEKRSVQQAILERKPLIAIIPGNVQGVVGGGENPFPTHDFFILFFIFIYFHDFCEVLLPQARNYSIFTQLLPNIAHMIMCNTFTIRSRPHFPPPLTIPSPRLRSRRVLRSHCQKYTTPLISFSDPILSVTYRKFFNTGSIRVKS